MANKNAIIVGVVVVIIAAAAIAAFALNNNSNDKNDPSAPGVGDTMTYAVFGNYGDDGTLIDGTMTFKILDETDTQIKYEAERSIYTVGTDGTRTALYVGKTTDWEDKDDDLVSKGTLTVDTFWGEKKLSYYESADGTQHVLKDGNIVYAGMIEGDDQLLHMELTDCTAIKEKKADREAHEATVVMSGDAVIGEYELAMTMTYTIDNENSVIFMRTTTALAVALEDRPEDGAVISSETSWINPFEDEMDGMVKTGTERIDTAWGAKDTDVYKKVDAGESYTMYVYKDIPLRFIYEIPQATFNMDVASLTLDGESVTPDEAAELL